MKVKTLICNCKGLDPFRLADMNTLPFEVESELDVSYAVVHPQLCAEGGNQILQDVLSSAENDPDTYVMVCACQEEIQKKLFMKALRHTEFACRPLRSGGYSEFHQRWHPRPNPRAPERNYCSQTSPLTPRRGWPVRPSMRRRLSRERPRAGLSTTEPAIIPPPPASPSSCDGRSRRRRSI